MTARNSTIDAPKLAKSKLLGFRHLPSLGDEVIRTADELLNKRGEVPPSAPSVRG